LKTEKVLLVGDYKKAPGLTHFLKGLYQDKKVQLLTGQESYKLNSFALSNCLIEIPADVEVLNTGYEVTIHII
jgi:molybdopterin molybdotransferase